ncbi:unnamed protein product [Peniophora sp. CBMAI 1063]|nr:unnamed protein product [Peniophora sp. CBMAI 1063]
MSRIFWLALALALLASLLKTQLVQLLVTSQSLCPEDVRSMLDLHVSGILALADHAPTAAQLADDVLSVQVAFARVKSLESPSLNATGDIEGDLHALRQQLVRLYKRIALTYHRFVVTFLKSFSSLTPPSARVAEHMLSYGVTEYAKSVATSSLPLAIGPRPPAPLYELFSSEFHRYQDGMMLMNESNSALEGSLQRLQILTTLLRGPHLAAELEAPKVLRKTFDDYFDSLHVTLAESERSALSSWPGLRLNCSLLQDKVHTAIEEHLRAMADIRRQVLGVGRARCSPLPGDEDSLFQASDLVPLIQRTLVLFDRDL